MLILSRRLGQSIVIGDGVTVTIVELRAGRVRLGISAPSEVAVHREEVFERIQLERNPDELAEGPAPAPLAGN